LHASCRTAANRAAKTPVVAGVQLTDEEWLVIEPLLPNKPRGVARVDDRRVINGILWRFRTGSPWADIPERYGPAHHLLQSLCALAQSRGVGPAFGGGEPSL
jgi:hypothetical protein